MHKETSGFKLQWDFFLQPRETIFNFILPVPKFPDVVHRFD
jgi:hypothetical protein